MLRHHQAIGFFCNLNSRHCILSSLCKVDSSAKQVFGLRGEVTASGMQRMALLIHGLRMVSMIGNALNMLGPDSESLEEYLLSTGSRHLRYGVKAEHFESLGRALRDALKTILKSSWTEKINQAWEEVFAELIKIMIRPMTTSASVIQASDQHHQQLNGTRNPAA